MSPPFRADHVGSFLRPARLRAAREKFFAREIDAAALRAVEDDCIREVVQRQQEVGLKGVTDGEFRRTYFHVDFLERLDGVEVRYGEFSSAFRKDDGTQVGFKPPTMHVESKVRHTSSIQGADYDFLKGVVTQTPKVCIPAPSMLHFRVGREAISQAVYPRLEDFYDDLTKAYADEIDDLARRGLRYLQLDDTNLAYLCDPAIRERTRARGDDPDALVRLYCKLVNDAIAHRPKDMTVTAHLCRGNFKSAWVAQGGYEPVAEILLNEMKIDGFFLEYDDERSGDFAPLRFTPKGVTVVLGLMSSKHAEAESKDAVKRRIDEAAAYVPLEQCALSHQCGFSSTAHGNDLSEDDQWTKLARCVEIAKDVWGEVLRRFTASTFRVSLAPMSDEPSRAHHDMGGVPRFLCEAVDVSPHDLNDFDRDVDAVRALLSAKKIMSVDELRRGIEAIPEAEYHRLTYYGRWIRSIADNLLLKGVFSEAELKAALERP